MQRVSLRAPADSSRLRIPNQIQEQCRVKQFRLLSLCKRKQPRHSWASFRRILEGTKEIPLLVLSCKFVYFSHVHPCFHLYFFFVSVAGFVSLKLLQLFFYVTSLLYCPFIDSTCLYVSASLALNAFVMCLPPFITIHGRI